MVVAVPIAWRPAHWVAASSFSAQMLPRWLWSISKALERVTPTDLMLASPGRVVRSNWREGIDGATGPLAPAELSHHHPRLEGQGGAVDRLERRGEIAAARISPQSPSTATV